MQCLFSLWIPWLHAWDTVASMCQLWVFFLPFFSNLHFPFKRGSKIPCQDCMYTHSNNYVNVSVTCPRTLGTEACKQSLSLSLSQGKLRYSYSTVKRLWAIFVNCKRNCVEIHLTCLQFEVFDTENVLKRC